MAWTIVGLIVLVNAAAIWLGLLDRHVQSLVATFMFAAVTVGFGTVGALIVSRERANSFGWLFIAMAVFLSVPHSLAQNYVVYALAVSPDELPGSGAALWISSSAFDTVFVMLMTLLVLLFPDGRPLTPRWRFVVLATVASGVAGVAGGFTDMTFSSPLADQTNPLLISAEPWSSLIQVVQGVAFVVSLAAFVLSVVSIVLRYRRSSGVRRQQMQWVAVGVLFEAVLVVVSVVLGVLGVDDSGSLPFVGAIVLFPALMAIAILRHRLYDIDLVIRRTLVYTCLVAVLALVYLGGIAILGEVFRSATGQSGAGRDAVHARRGGGLPAGAAEDPADDRPPLLVPDGRCRRGGPGVQRPAARADRPRRALPGVDRRCGQVGAAAPRDALAAAISRRRAPRADHGRRQEDGVGLAEGVGQPGLQRFQTEVVLGRDPGSQDHRAERARDPRQQRRPGRVVGGHVSLHAEGHHAGEARRLEEQLQPGADRGMRARMAEGCVILVARPHHRVDRRLAARTADVESPSPSGRPAGSRRHMTQHRLGVGHVEHHQPADDGVERPLVAPDGDVALLEPDVRESRVGRASGSNLEHVGRQIEADHLAARADQLGQDGRDVTGAGDGSSTRMPSAMPAACSISRVGRSIEAACRSSRRSSASALPST